MYKYLFQGTYGKIFFTPSPHFYYYSKITMSISNKSFEWIEEAISKKYIKYYDYKDFYNIEKIGNKKIGDHNSRKVYRTNLKNSEQYFALKSFNFDNAVIVKEIIHEVTIYILIYSILF